MSMPISSNPAIRETIPTNI